MVKECINKNIYMGIALATDKILHKKEKKGDRFTDINLDVYIPNPFFCAGDVEIIKEFDDGRMIIQVDNKMKVRIEDLSGIHPYIESVCEVIEDKYERNDKCDLIFEELVYLIKVLFGNYIWVIEENLNDNYMDEKDLKKLIDTFQAHFDLGHEVRYNILLLSDYYHKAVVLKQKVKEFLNNNKIDYLDPKDPLGYLKASKVN
jgi:ATP-dependent Lon protease